MYQHRGPTCDFGSQLPFILPKVCFYVVLRYRMNELSRSPYSLASNVKSYSGVWTGNSSRRVNAVDWQYTDHVTNPTNSSTGVLFFDSSQYSCFFAKHEHHGKQRDFMDRNKFIADS